MCNLLIPSLLTLLSTPFNLLSIKCLRYLRVINDQKCNSYLLWISRLSNKGAKERLLQRHFPDEVSERNWCTTTNTCAHMN